VSSDRVEQIVRKHAANIATNGVAGAVDAAVMIRELQAYVKDERVRWYQQGRTDALLDAMNPSDADEAKR